MQAFLTVTNVISNAANMETLVGEMHNHIKSADIGSLFAILRRNASLNDRIIDLEFRILGNTKIAKQFGKNP